MTQKDLAVLGQDGRARDRISRRPEKPALSRRMFVDIVAVTDIVLVIGSAFLIKYLYVGSFVETFASEGLSGGHTNYLTVIALVTGSLFAALGRRRHYNSESFENWEFKSEFIRLAFAVLFSFGFATLVLFFLKESQQFSRVWVFTWYASVFATLFTGKLLWSYQFRALAAKGYFRRRILLVGGGDAFVATRESLLSAQSQVELVCATEIDLPRKSGSANCCPLDTAVGDAISKGQAGGLDEVVVALPSSERDLLDHIVRRLKLLPMELKVALDFGNSDCKFVDISRVGSTNFASVQMKPISEWNVVLKSLEDYFLASLALLIFLPAMAVIAIAIKLDSKGPVFFRQRRHGSNHKIIRVLKFRTMTVMEDGDKVTQVGKRDVRVTRVGRFLRKTSLDELPQLINVLRGEMSLVGPRPHAVVHNHEFSLMFEDYASRHRVKPGITGWAQVNGFRGEITDPELLEKRVRYDLEYIDEWSIWFDLQILFMTPIFGFVSRRAY